MAQAKVLIIYTGGTIGMIRDEKKGTLKPFRLNRMIKSIPSILDLGIEIHAMELEEIIDSSNMTPKVWIELAGIIGDQYEKFDGFVVLHGSDTMAHTASALSFMLENLAKPVILTGSQLPIGLPRTDARENLITALEIASMKNPQGQSLVPEVCIYFEDQLYRGNRTYKFNSENFDAFLSPNYPILAEVGVKIEVFEHRLLPHPNKDLVVRNTLSNKVGMVQLFPGLDLSPFVDMFISTGTELVILETYGSGNGPTDKGFLSAIRKLVENNVLVYNVTQCRQGHVQMGKYEASSDLARFGVLSGDDITIEAALTKAMYVLASTDDTKERAELMERPLRGEMSS
ncbi:MAG: asparaginase [Flavobacteriales bacterium]|nr:asparaginase [Flavobacteriales bacterium]